MLLLLSFLFFFNDRLEQRDLRNYTRPIFTKFSEVLDVLVQMFSLVLVSGLVKGRCHGNQF